MSAREDELAQLIAEQEKDDQWGDRINYKRERSLDAPLGHASDAGTLAEVVGSDDRSLTLLVGGEESGIRRIPRPQKWTRRAIVKHIRAWVREHGEPPSYDDWRSPRGRGFPNTRSLVRCFGSFNAAIEAAGFEPCPRGGRKHEIQGTLLRPRMREQKCTSRLSRDDLAKAYVLYERGGLSTYQIAEKMWQRFGYPSVKACKECLIVGFYAEGFRVRSRGEARRLIPADQRKQFASAKRLTKAERLEIRARRGELQTALAAEYGVSVSAISYHQRTLAALPGEAPPATEGPRSSVA